jgi:hypothetical protein
MDREIDPVDHCSAPVSLDEAADFNGRHQRASRSAVKRD